MEQGINIKDILWMCLSRWYWYVLSLAVCCGFAFYQILKTPKVYQRNALDWIPESEYEYQERGYVDNLSYGNV